MARRIVVEVKTKLIIKVADGVDIDDVINELDYGFVPTDEGSFLISEEIVEHEVVSDTAIVE
jgi:hypothetical protein